MPAGRGGIAAQSWGGSCVVRAPRRPPLHPESRQPLALWPPLPTDPPDTGKGLSSWWETWGGCCGVKGMGPGGALTGEDPRDDLVGEVGGDEDSGQTDADLDRPEARPKHHPQNPARGRGAASAPGGRLPLPSGTPRRANTGSAASLFRFGAVPSPAPSLGARLTSTSASSTASCPTRWRAGRSPSRSTRLLRPWHGRRGSLGEKEDPGQTPVGSGCPLGLPRSGVVALSTHPQAGASMARGAQLKLRGLSCNQDRAEGSDHPRWLTLRPLAAPGRLQPQTKNTHRVAVGPSEPPPCGAPAGFVLSRHVCAHRG